MPALPGQDEARHALRVSEAHLDGDEPAQRIPAHDDRGEVEREDRPGDVVDQVIQGLDAVGPPVRSPVQGELRGDQAIVISQ